MQDNSRRIAKNTMYLYIRMFVMMLISLFTSRIILNTLGVRDYGIQNIVGGLVSMFSLLTGSISSAINRYLTFEIGKGDKQKLNIVFSTSINILALISVIVFLLLETLGVWFLNSNLNIPPERLFAANCVLQCAIISFVIAILMIPYNASIIAHEDMKVFANLSILDVILKLVIVYLLYITPFDRLITYSILLLSVTLLVSWIYWHFCRKHYSECHYRYFIDKKLTREMANFSGWSFIGDGSWILNASGVNILINMFFGVTLNAARGIATQVDGIVQQFVRNFITAIIPQITKSYANGNLEYMHKLVMMGAKYSFFILMFFSIPICLETETLLHFWLGDIVPNYSVSFVRFTLLTTMCISLGNTLISAVSSTGQIRNYQIVIGLMALSNFPLTWIAFELGFSPLSAYIIYFAVYFLMIFVRLYIAKDLIKMSATLYLRKVVFRSFIVLLLALIFPLVIRIFQSAGYLRLVEICIISIFSSLASIYFVGMSKSEKTEIYEMLVKKIFPVKAAHS